MTISPLPAEALVDRCRIEALIAAGGFGIIYRGRHVALGKVCASKEHFPRRLRPCAPGSI